MVIVVKLFEIELYEEDIYIFIFVYNLLDKFKVKFIIL